MTDKNQSMLENWSKTGQGNDFVNLFPLFSNLSTFTTRTCHFCARAKTRKMKFSSPWPGLKGFKIIDRTPLILSQRVVKFPLRAFSIRSLLLCMDAKVVNLISPAISKQSRPPFLSTRYSLLTLRPRQHFAAGGGFIHSEIASFRSCVWKKLSGKSGTFYLEVTLFKKPRFQNVFCPGSKTKRLAFSNSSGLKSVFEKFRFLDGLVWTVGLTVEIKLSFQTPSAEC